MEDNDVGVVRIASSKPNEYATIIRSMLTAANACRRLGKPATVSVLLSILEWAEKEFRKAVEA